MKHALGWAAHALCLASILLSIWLPFGGRGQWIATALVLLLLGSALLGSAEKRDAVPNSVTYSSDVPEHLRSEEGVEQLRAERRPTYGKPGEKR